MGLSSTGWLLLYTSYYYIYLYINVRGCVIAKRLRILKNAEIGVQYFWIIYLFCNRHSALSSTGWLLLYTSYYYIYLYINVRGCVSAKRLRISKNAEIGVQYFW